MAQTYLIRKPDEDTWRKFKMAAAGEGKSMRAIILRLVEDYVKKSGRRAA